MKKRYIALIVSVAVVAIWLVVSYASFAG